GGQFVDTPRGLVIVVNDEMRELRRLIPRMADTPSSDRYFFYPFMPMLAFLTAREHVSNYDILVPGYTTPSQYQEACTSALRRASWVVVDRNWTDPNFLRVIFPAMRDAEPRETKTFELAL